MTSLYEIPTSVYDASMVAIQKLPQADLLLSEMPRVNAWLKEAYRVDPDRIDWHIQRLSGIGGSEIGVAVLEMNGGSDAFETMRSIVESKLMMRAPQRANAAMIIGSLLEGEVRKEFYKRYEKFGIVRDDDSFKKLETAPAHRIRPWLIGNPDDIVLMGGRRFIPDYKVTISDSEEYSKSAIATRYVYQLHHYALVLSQYGVDTHGLILAPYVKDPAGYFQLLSFKVEKDPQKSQEIIAAGDLLWQHVMENRLPPYPKRSKVEITDEKIMGPLAEIARNFAAYETIAAAAYKKADEYKSELNTELDKHTLGDGKLRLADVVDVSVSGSLDLEKALEQLGATKAESAKTVLGDPDPVLMKNYLVEKGVDLTPFCPTKYDPELLEMLLKEEGELSNFFRKEKHRVGLIRSSVHTLTVNSARKIAESFVEQGSNEILGLIIDTLSVVVPEAPVKAKKPAKTKPLEMVV